MELLLDDVPVWLWDRFHEHARKVEVPRSFAPVIERWRRAEQLGAPPDGAPLEEHLLRGEALRVHEQRIGALAAAAERTMIEAQGFLAARGYLLLLADPDGVVVSARGGGDFADEARRVRLIEGACWSEASRGTNAIGTALTEGRPTAVKGHAHYGRSYQRLVCYASPIHGPSGEVLGVLDATSTIEHVDDVVGFTVTTAARAIEDALRQGAYASAGAAVARALGQAFDRVSSAVLLIEPPGRVARINAAALGLLGPIELGGRARAVLGLGWDELRAEASRPTPGGRRVRLADATGGLRVARLMIDPIETVDGSVIALVVYLETAAVPSPTIGVAPRPLGAATAPTAALARAGRGPVRAHLDPFARIFSQDDALDRALSFARRVAPSPVPVMVLAETGAGKELVARALHDASARADGPFVAVNCGAIAPSLLESELFGYAPGAFSGADRGGRAGYFAEATGGTLFLDEIAETSPAMQAALLRVLEDGTYRRVGETRALQADVRVVTATCRELPALIARREFRQDLYFRLEGAIVALPPLRARTDVVALAAHLLGELSARHHRTAPPAISPALAAWIAAQPWPGNVRELKSLLDVALVLAGDAATLELAHLPPDRAPAPTAPPAVRLDDIEVDHVRRVIDELGGNISAAAARLGVARSTIYRMLRRAVRR